jgi:tetratricopeptide (TPR) repeat protein
MKLVKGRTLEELLNQRKAPSENLPQLLGIFEQVCQTVAYAHARGVIHRDLKPANVMVGRFGEVQVMDWGLAKVLNRSQVTQADEDTEAVTPDDPRLDSGDLTAAGSVLGTWAYMPPEQARGLVADIDQRSDVFGLGAVLCEILTGQPPYIGPDAGTVRRQAMEAGLDAASTRLNASGADAELIQLAERCLAPGKANRPADGGEVASAVTAYRTGVQERLQQERVARERQEVQTAEGRRRHRVLAAATLGVLLTLSMGVVASTIFALRERAARQQAAQKAVVAEESLLFLEDVLFRANPLSEQNRDITLRKAVDLVTERLNEGKLKTEIKTPESNARVRITLGKIYFNLGEYGKSRDLFAEAHRIARDALGETHPTAMTALDQLGQTYMHLEEFANAERVLVRAYQLQREVLGPEHEDTIHTYAKLSDVYTDMRKFDKALEIGLKVLELRRKIWGDEYEFTLVSMNNLGLLYREMRRPEEALHLFEKAERIGRRTLGENHPSTLTYRHNIAYEFEELGRLDEALDGFSVCLAARRKVLGDGHPSTLRSDFGVALVQLELGKYAESRQRSESILRRMGSGIARDHTFRGRVLVNLGMCLTALGRYPEAEHTLQEGREILLKKVGPEHRFSRTAASALEELSDRRKTEESQENHREKRHDD